jgi:hypothetical protein
MNLTDLCGDLLRFIVSLEPESLRSLSLVCKATHEALFGLDVSPHAEHWRAFVTRRHWPAYAHIEAGKYEHVGKTWKEVARGWRDLVPWHYMHVQNPHCASCKCIILPTRCSCQPEGVIYKDARYRIFNVPTAKNTAFEFFDGPYAASSVLHWIPASRCILGMVDMGGHCEFHVVVAPASDLPTLPPWTSLFVRFI